MVMHARKLPRLDDGYFDKHQSHSYQANSKYSSSKGSYDRYNDRARDSPNGTGLRSDSPNSFGDSPRDRSYVHKSSYSQRIRDKERDKDRDRDREKERDKDRDKDREKDRDKDREKDRDKDRDRDNRSPRERDRPSRDGDRGRSSSNNHDRGASDDKPQKVGDWSEHVSSSGKKYYYNCKTEVSQWEKPRDWVDWEKEKEREERDQRYRRDRDRDRDRKYDRTSYSSSSSRTAKDKDKDKDKDGPSDRHSSYNRSASNSGNGHTSSSSRSAESRDNHRNHQQSLPEQPQSRRHSYERPSQDMDISPADSTPTSETSGPKAATPYTPDPRLTPTAGSSASAATPVSLATALPRLLSHPPTSNTPNQPMRPASYTPNASNSRAPNLMSPLQTGSSSTTMSTAPAAATSLSSLQQLLTQLTRTTVSGSMTAINPAIQSMLASTLGRMGNITALGSLQSLEHMELPAHEVLQSLQTLLSSAQIAVPASNVATLPKNMSSVSDGGNCHGMSAPTPPEGDPASATNGPPTPTHSERLEAEFRRGSAATSLSSLSAAAASLRPSTGSSHALTPSLAAHYRPDLIAHVTGWQAEHLEKQAAKVSEELHTIGNLHVTKVSAELKMARSLVRVADIQATLQEQRILFLRQQMKELEEMKPPNHFMSD